jgi:hypothetical protein
MANIQLYKIEFLQNNPYGDFVAGDILDVFIDDTLIVTDPTFFGSTGITNEKNGVSHTSSAVITFDTSVVSVRNFNLNICSGTSLVKYNRNTSYPYAQYVALANHNSCIINPETCDLIVVGSPSFVPASDYGVADGSITITATSTNTIKYKLNSDFSYDDGTGQLSNTFSALLPGYYRVFMRDSANCAANVRVNVDVSNVFGAIYRVEYDDSIHAGFRTKIDITKRGYSGAVTEVKYGGVPFVLNLRGEGVVLKHEPMLATDADITLASETNSAFIELYTNDRNLYRVNFYKDLGTGYVQKWTGKILPFIYMEPVAAAPYHTSVKAADGLAELKDRVFVQEDGQKFFGTVSLIKLVAYCLSLLKLDLNIRVGVNLYAVDMDQTAADDPLDQSYIDYECFYIAKTTPTVEFVLRHILKAFGARITQWNNVWNIVRVDEMADSYDYREFNPNGEYVSNSSYNPVKELDFKPANKFMLENGANLELQAGYGSVGITYKLGLKPNIITNGDFRLNNVYVSETGTYAQEINTHGFTLVNAGYALSEGYELLEDGGVAYFMAGGPEMIEVNQGGEAYLQTDQYFVKMGTNNQLKIYIRYKVVFIGRSAPPYVKLRIRVRYGSLYLQSDGTWSSDEQIVSFIATNFNQFVESEIIANQPDSGTPVDGMIFRIRLYHAYQWHAQFDSINDLEEFVTYAGGEPVIYTGYKTEIRDDFTSPSFIYYYELEENTSAASGYDIIRPDDYNATNNPRQWIKKIRISVNAGAANSAGQTFLFFIDKLRLEYLTGNKPSIDAIIRETTAEELNPEKFEDELIIGSYSELIVTDTVYKYYPRTGISPAPITTTTSILSAELIYTGWLRDSAGAGYEYWARDGVAESDKLHGIWLKSTSYQYNRTWRMLRGAVFSKTGYFSPIDSLKDVNDSNRKYIPISLSIDDKRNMASGEFLELNTDLTGGDEGSGSDFGSAFSTAFGSNFD